LTEFCLYFFVFFVFFKKPPKISAKKVKEATEIDEEGTPLEPDTEESEPEKEEIVKPTAMDIVPSEDSHSCPEALPSKYLDPYSSLENSIQSQPGPSSGGLMITKP
jgi:hypothetical protein